MAVTLLPLGVATFTVTVTVDPALRGRHHYQQPPGKYAGLEEDPAGHEVHGGGPGDLHP